MDGSKGNNKEVINDGKTAACGGKITGGISACDNSDDKKVPNELVDLAKKISRKNAENITWFPQADKGTKGEKGELNMALFSLQAECRRKTES